MWIRISELSQSMFETDLGARRLAEISESETQ
jgi:hypothetical protein